METARSRHSVNADTPPAALMVSPLPSPNPTLGTTTFCSFKRWGLDTTIGRNQGTVRSFPWGFPWVGGGVFTGGGKGGGGVHKRCIKTKPGKVEPSHPPPDSSDGGLPYSRIQSTRALPRALACFKETTCPLGIGEMFPFETGGAGYPPPPTSTRSLIRRARGVLDGPPHGARAWP